MCVCKYESGPPGSPLGLLAVISHVFSRLIAQQVAISVDVNTPLCSLPAHLHNARTLFAGEKNTRTANDSTAIPRQRHCLCGLQLYTDSVVGWWIILPDVTHSALHSCCVTGSVKRLVWIGLLYYFVCFSEVGAWLWPLTVLVMSTSNLEPIGPCLTLGRNPLSCWQ